jgi:hypothetical protein
LKGRQSLEEKNARILVDLILDPETPTDLVVKMIARLLAARRDDGFVVAMLREMVSHGGCPECGHENHWLVPEDELNKVGIVTADLDSRVKTNTTEADCPRWQEACSKKKVSI